MGVIIIAAMGSDRTIGVAGSLPWHLPADLAHFKELTTGHPVVMGRKTFESIGRPLPGRTNIVVTARRGWQVDGVRIAHGVDHAVREALRISRADNDNNDVFIIGGAHIYSRALRLGIVDELRITHVRSAPSGDTFFPEIDWSQWRPTGRIEHDDSEPAFDIVTYHRLPDSG